MSVEISVTNTQSIPVIDAKPIERRYYQEYTQRLLTFIKKVNTTTNQFTSVINQYPTNGFYKSIDIFSDILGWDYSALETFKNNLMNPKNLSIPSSLVHTEDGSILSFIWEEVKVNIIYATPFYKQLLDWNIGGLISVISKDMGLVINSKGLGVTLDKTFYLLTNDLYVYLQMFFHTSYLPNFADQPSMYRWVTTSKYFNQESFLTTDPIPVSDIDTIRGVDYSSFKEFISKPGTQCSDYNFRAEGSSKPWVDHLIRNYPDSVNTIRKIEEELKIQALLFSKINPELVAGWTNIPKKSDSVKFINDFKKEFSKDSDYKMFILESLPSTIKNRILKFKDTLVISSQAPAVSPIHPQLPTQE
jgi:hypothetical protein